MVKADPLNDDGRTEGLEKGGGFHRGMSFIQ